MKLTRKELYDLVWSEPMTTVCKRFGLTDNGLRKHCKAMNIPTPPVGYWAKLQYGQKVEKIPLPKDYEGKKQNVDFREVNPNERVELVQKENKQKQLEEELSIDNADYYIVPEVLYAKENLIIDTKEKLRLSKETSSDNYYLKKSPYKSKIKETLDIYVSDASIDRSLSIFSTIIKALRHRGHDIKIDKENTYAIVKEEEFRINIAERKKKDSNSDNPYSYKFCGELQCNIFYIAYDNWRQKSTKVFQDTAHTRLEDKIASIIAFMEVKAEEMKEGRLEEERRRIKKEEEERKRKEFEEKRKAELKEFQSLFRMSGRLYKANIIRDYIRTYEEFLQENKIENEEIIKKIAWAKEKADWLDPFISKEDEYLDYYDKDEVTQLEHSRQQTSWPYRDNQALSGSGYNYWAKPWYLKKR